jgi:hypothetical protein
MNAARSSAALTWMPPSRPGKGQPAAAVPSGRRLPMSIALTWCLRSRPGRLRGTVARTCLAPSADQGCSELLDPDGKRQRLVVNGSGHPPAARNSPVQPGRLEAEVAVSGGHVGGERAGGPSRRCAWMVSRPGRPLHHGNLVDGPCGCGLAGRTAGGWQPHPEGVVAVPVLHPWHRPGAGQEGVRVDGRRRSDAGVLRVAGQSAGGCAVVYGSANSVALVCPGVADGWRMRLSTGRSVERAVRHRCIRSPRR